MKLFRGRSRRWDTYTSRKTDLGQLKTVILGEGLLRDSARLDALLGELERSQAVSEKVMLLAADSAAAWRGKGHEGGQQDRSVPLGFL